MLHSRRSVQLLAVILIATLSIVAPRGAAAAGCAGTSHELQLTNGTVSPGSGTAGSTFTFGVTYQDNGSCAPDRIVVVIEGLGTYALGYVSGNLASGATFRVKLDLPAGRRSYRFEASSGSGNGKRSVILKN